MIFLLIISIILIILLTPVSYTESFTCSPNYIMGQGEYDRMHRTDIHSRIPLVRLPDPTSRWSQPYL